MSAAVEGPEVIAASARATTAKTIVVDTWCLGAYARNHGVHVYSSKLLEHFRELAPRHGIEVVPFTSRLADNDANLLQESPGFRPRETALLRFNRLWRFGGACTLAKLQKADLAFSPHCTSLYFQKITPAVVTMHDVIPLRMPWASKRITQTVRFCLWSAAKFSRAIITVSQHSKVELLEAYRIPESKVFVVYNGCDSRVFNNLAADPDQLRHLLERLGIARPYILHHGAIKPNKNLKSLIMSYDLLAQRHRSFEFDLVLAGPLGWEYQDVLTAANQGSGRVILTGALSQEDLVLLIKGAQLAVFPSLYEGFCLPMVEAMACGVSTISADNTCLPEISGGVLKYFNPESVEEMSNCIDQVLQSDDLRRELSEKGLARARQFDWKRCAEETLEVLTKQLELDS